MGIFSLPQLPVTGWLIVACISYIIATFVYAFLLSPLRNVPGPWWARVTRIPQWYANYYRNRTAYSSQILEKYGKQSGIVIIAPNEVFTTDEAAIKTIYSKESKRVEWYHRAADWKGYVAALGNPYRLALPYRQDMLKLFSGTNLAALTDDVCSHVDGFLRIVDSEVKGGQDTNLQVVLRLLALDVVTDVAWGETERFLETSYAGSEPPKFLGDFFSSSMYRTQVAFFPVFEYWVKWSPFGTKQWRAHKKRGQQLDKLAHNALSRWNEQEDHRQRDYMSAMRSRGVSEGDIISHLIEVLAAGSGTVERTACIALTHLKDHPEVQEKLRKELREAFPDKNDINQRRMLDLPYLDAFIKESARLKPAVPGPQQRYLPSSMTVGGLCIPPGTIASIAPQDQGQLPDVFPEPHALRPERWLATETSKEHLSRMNHNWFAFGYGVRTCPGLNLAMLEMKYIVGTMVRLYNILDARDHPTANLDSTDLFVCFFKNGSCWVRLEEVDA